MVITLSSLAELVQFHGNCTLAVRGGAVSVLLPVVRSTDNNEDLAGTSLSVHRLLERFDEFSPDGDIINCVMIHKQPAFDHPLLKGHKLLSPDGDIIDCVMIHKQPAFDHPLLKGHKLLDPPEIPKEHNQTGILNDNFQLWSLSGESCPDKTIPILRNIKDGIMSKPSSPNIFKRESINEFPIAKHEYAIAKASEGEYYGAKAIFNVWEPYVSDHEFSLAQMWVASASTSGTERELHTLEVGWQVCKGLYGDNLPKLFVYWTMLYLFWGSLASHKAAGFMINLCGLGICMYDYSSILQADTYKTTGCYNLKCPGFVQTNKKILLGGSFTKISKYNGKQYCFTPMIWKDSETQNWWLRVGPDIIGYWPSSLVPLLKNHASLVHFGGEIVDTGPNWYHTYTQMGSGNFPNEGFGRAAYVRTLQVMEANNYLTQIPIPQFEATFPNCYDIKQGFSNKWGKYFYYGGPGQNSKCTRGNK
ncbi:protein neprosin-like [Cicer arietinum]|uniref:protein neprosin-like n=1 Tax=Cicer arietinum TaxID=3827 RepID=UPI003CC58A58